MLNNNGITQSHVEKMNSGHGSILLVLILAYTGFLNAPSGVSDVFQLGDKLVNVESGNEGKRVKTKEVGVGLLSGVEDEKPRFEENKADRAADETDDGADVIPRMPCRIPLLANAGVEINATQTVSDTAYSADKGTGNWDLNRCQPCGKQALHDHARGGDDGEQQNN